MNLTSTLEILSSFIPKVEGFSASPYWDYKQWSWGYGTACGFDKNKKPQGTITREDALKEAEKHYVNDFTILASKVKVELQPWQWAALLSFSYNEGVGNAQKLLSDINSKSVALEAHWKKYIYAGGKVNKELIARRNKEWFLWTT